MTKEKDIYTIVNDNENTSYEVLGGVIFKGKIKSINEFRNLIKMLEI